jgi:hypothetical protein
VTAILESNKLSSMNLASLFGKLQEHELELNQLFESEEGENNEKRLAFKANFKENKEDMKSVVHVPKTSMRHKCKEIQSSHTKRKAYIAWEDNGMTSSDESKNEETNLCFMANHEEEEVNSFESEPNFTYEELLFICEELNKESSKLRKIVSTSKKTISTLESKIEVLNKEIDILKEKQVFVSKVSTYTPCENKKENIECNECNILKDKVEDLNNVLAKFTMGRDKLDIILGNQKGSYNKAGLGYQPKRDSLPFKRNFSPNKTSSRPFVKCFYCNKSGHTSSICNLRKNQYLNNRWEGISNDGWSAVLVLQMMAGVLRFWKGPCFCFLLLAAVLTCGLVFFVVLLFVDCLFAFVLVCNTHAMLPFFFKGGWCLGLYLL